MKKILSVLLTLAMVFGMCIPAFAADVTIASTESGSNSAKKDVSASYTPTAAEVPEAKWGASADDLSGSGTLAEAFTAAKDDSTVKYIQVQKNITANESLEILGGTFTLDLNGKCISGSESLTGNVIDLPWQGTASNVTFKDSASGGKVVSTSENCGAVGVDIGTVTFDGGSYESAKCNALDISSVGGFCPVVTIKGGTFTATGDRGYAISNGTGGTLTIEDCTASAAEFYGCAISNMGVLTVSGGNFTGDKCAIVTSAPAADNPYAIANAGTVTITGGTFFGQRTAAICYGSGKLDLSGYPTSKLDSLTVNNYGTAVVTVGDDTVKLPAGYGLYKSDDTAKTIVTTLEVDKIYGITTVGEETKAVITGVNIKVGDVTYTSGTVTLTPDSGSVTVIVYGTDLDKGTAGQYVQCSNSVNYTMSMSEWVINSSGTTATVSIPLDRFKSQTTAYSVGYSNDGTNVVNTAIYIIYQEDIVSVEITWGSMSFTYSDEQVDGADKGWSCEDGANVVTVKNSGTVKVKADVSYTAKADYTAISGAFDKPAATLAATESADFTLTLYGKPEAALTNAEIGTVTVTVTRPAEGASSDVTVVST